MIWDVDKVEVALRSVGEIRKGCLTHLQSLINDYGRTNHSRKYVQCVAGDWLEHFIHHIVASLADKTEKINFRSATIPVASDTREYGQLSQDLGMHLGISRFISENPSKRSATEKICSLGVKRSTWKGKNNNNILLKALAGLSSSNYQLLMTAPYNKCSRYEFGFKLCKWLKWVRCDNLDLACVFDIEIDWNWRIGMCLEDGHSIDTMGYCRRLMPLMIPVALLEGLKEVKKRVLALSVKRPKGVYSANALHGHLAWKILAAEWREQGTQILYHQHGGGYGLDYEHSLEQLEIDISDRYYTWGWGETGDGKVKAMSPAIMRVRAMGGKKILFNLVNYPMVPYRIHYQPMPGTIELMHEETIAFIKKLSNRNELMVRPYFNDYGWNMIPRIMDVLGSGVLDCEGVSSKVRYEQSKLVVHNYLGTSYLETLGLNIPTIAFYDARAYRFRDEARELMEDLEKVGIIHGSGISAATFLNEIHSDPVAWWHKTDVQAARMAFVKKYARFSENWSKEWENEFLETLAA